jgi:hypothetical protein
MTPLRKMRSPWQRVKVADGDWVKTFPAAQLGRVENHFVEQSWELTQQSVAYLKTLRV